MGRRKRLEGAGRVAVFKQGVLDGCPVNRTQQGPAQHASHAHHVEGVQGEVVEALHKQDEAEDPRDPKAGSEEPTGLPQGVHQKHRHKHRNRRGEGDRVVGPDADQPGDLNLPQAEADQGKGPVQGDKGPQAAQLAPAGKVALGFRAPQQQQGVAQAVGGGGDGHGQEVTAFQVAGGEAVGVPGGHKGGAGEPAAQGHVGAGEQQQT